MLKETVPVYVSAGPRLDETPTIASPVPLHFTQSRSNDAEPNNLGRETPLPRYEKTQPFPFTLNLQEDANHPGRFQLVVNISSKEGVLPGEASLHSLPAPGLHGDNTSSAAASLQAKVDSQLPSTPLKDKQDWADLDNVPSEFLQQVVPDWHHTFSRSDSVASTQNKKLANIKASIKKKGKGFVVRLLKGSSTDPNDVAEVDLGRAEAGPHISATHELDCTTPAVELDSVQIAIPSSQNVLRRADICEIGASNEPNFSRFSDLPLQTTSSENAGRIAMHGLSTRNSIADDGFSDAETLITEIQSSSRQNEGNLQVSGEVQINRSHSGSSIVRTPTRGLSVVGVRRPKKSVLLRQKSIANNLDHNRSGTRKSVRQRSPRTSLFASTNQISPGSASPGIEDPRQSQLVFSTNIMKARHARKLSADEYHKSSAAKANLRLQTSNLPIYRSVNVSPKVGRKESNRSRRAVKSSSTSNSPDPLEEQSSSPDWPEIDHSEELREALGKVLSSYSSGSKPPVKKDDTNVLPTIVEPNNDDHIGGITLPSEFEIRSVPLHMQNPSLKYWSLALSALSEKAFGCFKLLQTHFQSEPPVSKGHKRVRWTCSCGEHLYDDFVEQRPGATRLLEAYLNRPRAHTPQSPASQSSSVSTISSLFDASSRASTLTTPSSTFGGPSSWKSSKERTKYSPTRIRSNNPFSVRMPTYAEESWLLTCANEGKLTPKVVHIDVNESRIRSDKDLALALCEHHDQLNRKWYSWARLRGLTTIEFVQFEIHRNRFADIRAAPSMPPKSASSSITSPDPEKSSSSPSQHPYTFEPNDLLPPVGSTYLLHLFKHPNDYDGELITYLRCPKRRARLEFGMAWGVHLVEGFLAQQVWAFVMAICGLGSAAFAIAWTFKKGDVQGAFGVAQWVIGLAALFVGALQTWLE